MPPGLAKTANTDITNAITNVAATGYATLLPTADIANALVTSIPADDVNLFLTGVEDMVKGDLVGGLQYALIAPLALAECVSGDGLTACRVAEFTLASPE